MTSDRSKLRGVARRLFLYIRASSGIRKYAEALRDPAHELDQLTAGTHQGFPSGVSSILKQSTRKLDRIVLIDAEA